MFTHCYVLRANLHGVPSPKFQVTWGQSLQSQLLRAWNLGLTTSHGSQLLSSKHDMDAYITIFFGGEAWDLCSELVKQKFRPNSQPKSQNKLLTLMICNHIWMISRGSWDVYIMDHEVVPRPCKKCDWLLTSSWTTLVYS